MVPQRGQIPEQGPPTFAPRPGAAREPDDCVDHRDPKPSAPSASAGRAGSEARPEWMALRPPSWPLPREG
eukprot:12268612-Heterocapsa_arctica.AAC.1